MERINFGIFDHIEHLPDIKTLKLLLPADFSYPTFGALLLTMGLAMGLFASPNAAGIMNSVPPRQRGVAGHQPRH